MKLSNNFKLEELIESSTAIHYKINNYPSPTEIDNLRKLCETILQPIRDKFGKAIYVTSGYRNPILNRKVKGSPSSQHIKGEAADITSIDNRMLWDMIVEMINNKEITVGQLIWECGDEESPDWIHISLPYKKTNEILYLR